MFNKIAKPVLYAEITSLICLILCVVLIPHFLFEKNEGGVSNYGIIGKTVVPYSVAFAGLALGLLMSASKLPKSKMRRLCKGLALFYLLVLISTYGYKTSNILGNIHEGFSVVLFWVQFGIAFWFYKQNKDLLNRIIIIFQGIDAVLGVLNFTGVIHILFITEIVSFFSFGIILTRAVNIYSASL